MRHGVVGEGWGWLVIAVGGGAIGLAGIGGMAAALGLDGMQFHDAAQSLWNASELGVTAGIATIGLSFSIGLVTAGVRAVLGNGEYDE